MIWLIAFFATASQDKSFTFEAEGEHYRVRSTADRASAMNVLAHMDLCFPSYGILFPPEPGREPKEKLSLILYATEKEYRDRSGPGSFGRYTGRHLVGFIHPDQTLPTFSHEGAHQFLDASLPNVRRLPMWYSEGMAECFASNEVRDGCLRVCLSRGPVPKLRLPAIQKALKEDAHLGLREFLMITPEQFQRRHGLMTAQSWSLCHFLLAAPLYEDPGKTVPEGARRSILDRLHAAFRNPATDVLDAITAALTADGKAIDIVALEREWREYVLAFPDPGK